MQNKILISLVGIVVLVFGVGLFNLNKTIDSLNQSLETKQGAIGNENGYYATTTDSTWSSPDGTKILKNGYGVLGSVTIPTATAGTLTFYDGTTTGSHVNYATTSLGTFPTSATAGSYHLDVNFQRGLIAVWSSTALGVSSSTITWK